MKRCIFLLLLFLVPDSSEGADSHQLDVGRDSPQEPVLFSASDVAGALAVADELERARRFALARGQLRAVAKGLSLRQRGETEFRICRLWERDEERARARECYLALTSQEAGTHWELRASAEYRAALLGEGPRALTALVAVAMGYPRALVARRALVAAREIIRERVGELEGAEFSLRLALEFEGRLGSSGEISAEREQALRGLAAECWLEAGRFYSRPAQDSTLGLEFLQRAREVAKGTVWWDDATLALARELVRVRALPQAREVYRQFINRRESSWFVGAYDSQFLDEAMFEYGNVLELLELGREAREAYLTLIAYSPSSRLADDAAYRALVLAPAVQRRGALKRFVKAYPNSEYLSEAKRVTR